MALAGIVALALSSGCSVAPTVPTPGVATSATAATASATAGPHVAREFLALWRQRAEAIGAPQEPAVEEAGGLRQRFAHGDMYYSSASGAAFLSGALKRAFDGAGGIGVLGYPIGLADCTPAAYGCAQRTLSAWLYAPKGGSARTVSDTRTARLERIENFRDLAGDGAGLPLAAGGHLRRGVLYRSARLTPQSAHDLLVLDSLGLSTIYDLRTPSVAARYPDPSLPGVSRRLFNIYAVASRPGPTWRTVAEAENSMRAMYRAFVEERAQRSVIASLLTALADEDGPALIHCTEGKDRTGWVAALVQLNAGVRPADVQDEYLKSNSYRAASIAAAVKADAAAHGAGHAEGKRALLEVQPAYLEAALASVQERYGGWRGYLTKGLGLSPDTLERLRSRLTGP